MFLAKLNCDSSVRINNKTNNPILTNYNLKLIIFFELIVAGLGKGN